MLEIVNTLFFLMYILGPSLGLNMIVIICVSVERPFLVFTNVCVMYDCITITFKSFVIDGRDLC